MKPDCHTVRRELVENVLLVSQPHYSKTQCPFTKPNLTDFFEYSTLAMKISQGEDVR